MGALPKYHVAAGRHHLQPPAAGACADFLQAHFGLSGLGGQLTVLRLRGDRAHAMAHTGAPDQITWARQLLDLHDQAVAAGRFNDAAAVFCLAMDAVGELEPGAYTALQPTALRYIGRPYDPPPTGPLQVGLTWASLAEGLLEDTERHLADLLGAGEDNPSETSKVRGWMALQRGDYDEAESQFHKALSSPGGANDAGLLRWLELCARARKSGKPGSFREDRLRRPRG